jgi:hypothetical protein
MNRLDTESAWGVLQDKNQPPNNKTPKVEEEPEAAWHEQLGGEVLVQAVFKKLFPDNFLHVLPIRNHKVTQ